MKNKLIAFLVAFVPSFLGVWAQTGTNDNLNWELSNDTLRIFGSGPMTTWERTSYPWNSQRTNIVHVVIEEGVTTIGEYAFSNCTNLFSIVIPNSVTFVSSRAFGGSNNLAYLDVPDMSFAYALPNRLKHVTIRGGGLDEDAFECLRSSRATLTYLDLFGTSCSSLPERALNDCYRLDTLLLPAGLERLKYKALAECTNLAQVNLPASLQEIDDRAFENCRSLLTVTFNGNNLTRIGKWAFFQCLQLQNITIPQGVTEIGNAAFYECAYLNSVSLPSSVLQIGDYAFANCSRMTRMDVDAVAPPTVNVRTFDEVSRTMPVYVPDICVNTYKADPLWGQLNVVGASSQGTSLHDVDASGAGSRKTIIDGQVRILRGDKTYSVTGQEVK